MRGHAPPRAPSESRWPSNGGRRRTLVLGWEKPPGRGFPPAGGTLRVCVHYSVVLPGEDSWPHRIKRKDGDHLFQGPRALVSTLRPKCPQYSRQGAEPPAAGAAIFGAGGSPAWILI